MLRFAFKPRHPVTRVAFTADGREIITAQPFTGIALRDRLTGEARVTIPMLQATEIPRLEVHPTLGGIAFCSLGRRQVLDPVTGIERPSRVLAESRHQVCLSPESLGELEMWWYGSTDGDRMNLEIFDRGTPIISRGVRSERLNAPFRYQHLRFGGVVSFSPDGTYLAIGGGEDLRVFDLRSFEASEGGRTRFPINPVLTLERPDPTQHGTFADKHAEQWLPPVAFDHAGRSLFTLGLRNRVQRIDLATGGVMAEWGWRCEPIRSLAVSPDDLTAAAGCQRGELVLWDLE